MQPDRHGHSTDDLVRVLQQHLAGSPPLSEPDLHCLASLMTLRYVAKGAPLLTPGEICEFQALVVRGCLRVYFAEPHGAERVLSFAPEGWWVTDVESFLWECPASVGIAAVEPTAALIVDKPSLQQFQSRVPDGERIAQLVAERMLVMMQRRLIAGMRKAASQRYLEFQRLYPGLDSRIAQYHIAAYLGVSPEFLSKLRGRLAKSHQL